MSKCSFQGCENKAIRILPLSSNLPVLGETSFEGRMCQKHLDEFMGSLNPYRDCSIGLSSSSVSMPVPMYSDWEIK